MRDRVSLREFDDKLELAISHATVQRLRAEIGEREAGKDDKESFLNMRVTLMPIDEATKLQSQPEPLVFTERSKFVRNPAEAGTWLYASGDVKSEAQGFKDRTLKNDKDLAAMKKDVDYVQKLIKDKTKK